MKPSIRKQIKDAFFIACLILAQYMPPASCGFSEQDGRLLDEYKAGITGLDPAAAEKFLNDTAFMASLNEHSAALASLLAGNAHALAELALLLDDYSGNEKWRELGGALAMRTDTGSALSGMGLGPEPEKLLLWTAKYRPAYTPQKTAAIKLAMREWESLGGDEKTMWLKYCHMDEMQSVDWDDIPEKEQIKKTEKYIKAWKKLNIRERKSVSAQLARAHLSDYLDNRLRLNTSEDVKNFEALQMWKNLDAAGSNKMARHAGQARLLLELTEKIPEIKSRLSDAGSLPLEQQVYLAGKLYDNTPALFPARLGAKLDSARMSRPAETFNSRDYPVIADMLKTALLKEISLTQAGKTVLDFYSKNALNLKIETCSGCYGKFEPSSDSIKLDTNLIQQFLRINKYKTENLLNGGSEPVKNLARFLAPVFMHETAHYIQSSWAKSRGVYFPYVQEKETEANYLQAAYVLEKTQNDGEFRLMAQELREIMPYVDNSVKMAQNARELPYSKFKETTRWQYSGVPSFDFARSSILTVVAEELQKRQALPAGGLKNLEETGLDMQSLAGLTLKEFKKAVSGIKPSILAKIKEDFFDKEAGFKTYFTEAQKRAQENMASLNSGETIKQTFAAPVPAP